MNHYACQSPTCDWTGDNFVVKSSLCCCPVCFGPISVRPPSATPIVWTPCVLQLTGDLIENDCWDVCHYSVNWLEYTFPAMGTIKGIKLGEVLFSAFSLVPAAVVRLSDERRLLKIRGLNLTFWQNRIPNVYVTDCE